MKRRYVEAALIIMIACGVGGEIGVLVAWFVSR
jgi:hypothetical protein